MIAPARVRRGFEDEILVLAFSVIEPTRKLDASVLRSVKYRRIIASLPTAGLVEPLVVVRSGGGRFRLLDGHARMLALQGAGITEARCLVALDDEAFTYNKRISHLATIQEHYMIVRALAKGASEERIAASLNLDVESIRLRRTMLDGICPEVIDRLKSRSVNMGVFAALKRMKPLRQIEVFELMSDAGNVTASYARVLLAGTRPADLVAPEKARKPAGLGPEQIERMQREMETVQANFKTVEKTYGQDVLNLVVATGYVGALIQNPQIQRYLEDRYPEYLTQFRSIVRATSLDQHQP